MTFVTKYVNFWARVGKEGWVGFLVVGIFVLCYYFNSGDQFGSYVLPISLLAFIYFGISVANVWTYVYEIEITNDEIIITGVRFDTRWQKAFIIRESEIKIKSKGAGRGNVEYYLRLNANGKTVDINYSLNWDYPSLLRIFHEFKRIKGEKIIFDEKYFLNIMEKKAQR